MKTPQLPIEQYLPNTGQLVFGCMGLGGSWDPSPLSNQDIAHARLAIDTALEQGVKLFDHADIYTLGKAEQVFGKILEQTPGLRDNIYIQSKCGIRFADETGSKRYDFSAQWVTQSVEGILNRLQIEQLDVLMLHRPDALVEFDELARALGNIQKSGKVRHFGVSNMSAAQIQQLQSRLDTPIVSNQLEMSLAKSDFVRRRFGLPGIAPDYIEGTLEYCVAQKIQLQAWGCLAQGRFSQKGLSSEEPVIRQTAEYVATLANEFQVPSEAIVLAFLLRHPAGIQPVIGTTNPERIRACARATEVMLSREQWYTLFEKSLGHPIP